MGGARGRGSGGTGGGGGGVGAGRGKLRPGLGATAEVSKFQLTYTCTIIFTRAIYSLYIELEHHEAIFEYFMSYLHIHAPPFLLTDNVYSIE